MTDLGFLRQSKTGHAGSSTHVRLALLSFVGATSSLLLGAVLTTTSRGPFGHGHLTTYSAVPR